MLPACAYTFLHNGTGPVKAETRRARCLRPFPRPFFWAFSNGSILLIPRNSSFVSALKSAAVCHHHLYMRAPPFPCLGNTKKQERKNNLPKIFFLSCFLILPYILYFGIGFHLPVNTVVFFKNHTAADFSFFPHYQ